MADKFQLRVVTPTREAVNAEVLEVTAPGSVGEFGILPDHAAFLSSLEIGSLIYRTSSGENKVAIREGFAEVSDNVMTVLSESAATPDDVDADTLRAEVEAANKQLEDLSIYDDAYHDLENTRRWAEAQLELVR